MGFEPTTASLVNWGSTPELLPHFLVGGERIELPTFCV